MKKEGTLKKVLAILVILLLCLVSFGGIYVKDRNVFKNILPDYVLGMDLDTNTILKLDVDKSADETAEEQANVEENTEENQENNESTETEKKEDNGQVQKENKYTVDNYKKSKEIMEKRLKLSGIEQYTIRLDEETGSIVLEFPDKVKDGIIAYSLTNGDVQFNIKANETKKTEAAESTETAESTEATKEESSETANTENNESEENKEENKPNNVTGLIADNKSIKKVTLLTKNMEYVKEGGSYIQMDIEFTNDAIKKFKDIKNGYVVPTDENGAQNENTVTLSIDGMEIYTRAESVFLESAINGRIEIDSNYATDAENLADLEETFNGAKAVLETEKLPLTYTSAYQNKVHSNISSIGIISVFVVILAVMLIYLVIKFKLYGVFAELAIVGFGALLMLVLRWTSVQISVASIVSIAALTILQFIYLNSILNNGTSKKVFNKQTIEYTKMLIPAFIFGIFAAALPALKNIGIIPGNTFDIASFGMVVFWGLIVFELFNNIITRAIITNAKNK
ncbi:MAG: hypothetical protein IKQ33_05305 [Clostridia bacterium]|nr:hypothetical protein [Clostridia bacterium]